MQDGLDIARQMLSTILLPKNAEFISLELKNIAERIWKPAILACEKGIDLTDEEIELALIVSGIDMSGTKKKLKEALSKAKSLIDSPDPIMNPDGSPSATTLAFATEMGWTLARVELEAGIRFPVDMLRYDACMFCTSQDELLSRRILNSRAIYIKQRIDAKRPWTPERWESFGCKLVVYSGKTRS